MWETKISEGHRSIKQASLLETDELDFNSKSLPVKNIPNPSRPELSSSRYIFRTSVCFFYKRTDAEALKVSVLPVTPLSSPSVCDVQNLFAPGLETINQRTLCLFVRFSSHTGYSFFRLFKIEASHLQHPDNTSPRLVSFCVWHSKHLKLSLLFFEQRFLSSRWNITHPQLTMKSPSCKWKCPFIMSVFICSIQTSSEELRSSLKEICFEKGKNCKDIVKKLLDIKTSFKIKIKTLICRFTNKGTAPRCPFCLFGLLHRNTFPDSFYTLLFERSSLVVTTSPPSVSCCPLMMWNTKRLLVQSSLKLSQTFGWFSCTTLQHFIEAAGPLPDVLTKQLSAPTDTVGDKSFKNCLWRDTGGAMPSPDL